MLNYEALKIINKHIKIYSDFPLPAVICDIDFQVYWANRRAKDSFARLTEPDGLSEALSGFGLEALLSDVIEKSNITLSGVLPFSDANINLFPIVSDKDVAGIVALFISPDAVPSSSARASRAAEAFSEVMFRDAGSIFSALDSAYLKSIIMDEHQWLSPHLNQITAGAYRLLRMSANFSEYAKRRSGEVGYRFETVDLFSWLRGISEAVCVIADKAGVPVEFDIEDGPAFARIDMASFQTAFFNVIYNALSFTKENNRVEISAFRSGGIAINVNDFGIGMDNETMTNAFQPFYATSNASGNKGAGLGLTLADMIMKAHGGTITLESTPGTGSTVAMHLPPISFSQTIPFEQTNFALDMARLAIRDRFSALYVGLKGIELPEDISPE